MPANHRHERHHRHGCEEVAYLRGFFDDDEHDDGETVPEYTINPPSCRNRIGIGKSIAHDAPDAHDDESQRFSKGGAPPSRELGRGAREPVA